MSSTSSMSNIKLGFTSGFVATVIAFSMMAMNNAVHGITGVHVARTLAGIVGAPDKAYVGWLALLVLGVFVFGGLFAVYSSRVPFRSYLVKGVALGGASWLIMMIVIMPLGGAGLFGLDRSAVVPFATLILNLVYWVVLALTYRWVAGPQSVGQRTEA